jgi:hypothetical protein
MNGGDVASCRTEPLHNILLPYSALQQPMSNRKILYIPFGACRLSDTGTVRAPDDWSINKVSNGIADSRAIECRGAKLQDFHIH